MSNSKRGFAGMTPERRREVARLGGVSAQAQGHAHQWTSAEARAAGMKSWQVRQAKLAAKPTKEAT